MFTSDVCQDNGEEVCRPGVNTAPVRAELLSQHWARAVTHRPAGSCNYQCLAEMDLEQNIADM